MFMLAVCVMSACATKEVWRSGAKENYVKLVPDKAGHDVEAALAGSDKQYYCENPKDEADKMKKVCFMKVSEAEKNKDLKIKFLKTPEAIVTDVGNTILFVGFAVVYVAFGAHGDDGCRLEPHEVPSLQYQPCKDRVWGGGSKTESAPEN
jgi:hypothetical protein